MNLPLRNTSIHHNIMITYFIYITTLIIFTSSIANSTNVDGTETATHDSFEENLFIKPLADGKLYAHFSFRTLYRKNLQQLKWENKFQLFPLTIADLVSTADLKELHFSLTKGNWNYKTWGYSTRPSPTGAQIRVLFSERNENLDKSWEKLVHSLAGLFCTSLISASNRRSISNSRLAFNLEYHSTMTNSTLSKLNNNLLYVNLPEETLCTENLTPWKKLLPCYSNSGLASLLNAVHLLQSSYSTLAIDLEPVRCDAEQNCEHVQLTQTIGVVFNPLNMYENKHTWSLMKLFGNPIRNVCPVARKSNIHVDVTDLDDINKLNPNSYSEKRINDYDQRSHRVYATYHVNGPIDVGIKQNQLFKPKPLSERTKIPITLETHVAGKGISGGTICATISNVHDEPIRVTYMHAIPHFLKVYFHTLTIKTNIGQELKPDELNFALGKGSSTALIEFSILIPPNCDTRITYEFERAFLKWTEFKPDANKGILVGSAMLVIDLCPALKYLTIPINSITSNSSHVNCVDSTNSGQEGDAMKIYARPLLFILPTPDFSMPYNVVCLVCTVLMLAFGPLHNFTTRRPVIQSSKRAIEKKREEDELSEESKKDK